MGPTNCLWGFIAAALLALPHLAEASVDECSGVLASDALPVLIDSGSLLQHLQALQSHADMGNGSRVAGSYGHNLTIEYIQDHLRSAGYYVEVQPFHGLMQVQGKANLIAGGQNIRAEAMAWSPNYSAEYIPIVPVNGPGCRAIDYPSQTFGAIALVGSGGCSFSDKSKAAREAGAGALLLRESTELNPSLGGLDDHHIPSARISEKDAQALEKLPLPLWAHSIDISTHSEQECGDEENTLMVGTHTDSTDSSAGINDNASGIASLLEVASRLTKFKTNSKVKFAFWTASEPCLLGSRHWFDTKHDEELSNIRLYLDVNMIGSPNGALKVYDGNGTYFKIPGPHGSDKAEAVLADGFAAQEVSIKRAEISNRSDYAPFFEYGIPIAGLFSGADGFKTREEFNMFGGQPDRPYDNNYHQAGDDLENINTTALLVNTKALAHAVGVYGRGFDGFPEKKKLDDDASGYAESTKYSGVIGLAWVAYWLFSNAL
ncbi:hypothetical protein F4818DRAFT_456735 [Hypoxylon cercidicola]|nr:hypothetical protein F4818DRAFT_456735 [Hypoxylon cercidicola]